MHEIPDIRQRLAAYLEKVERDRKAGFDRRAEANAVLDTAGPLAAPVLDIGVGKGFFALEVARRGCEVVGVDVSPEALAFATALAEHEGVGDRLRLVEADASSLPFGDGAFGTVVSMNALHHLEPGDGVLASAFRLVRPGGLIVLADLTPEGLDWIGRQHLQEKGEPHPVGPVTLETASAWLAVRGMQILDSRATKWEAVTVLRKPAQAS